jgi:hypothetical protein
MRRVIPLAVILFLVLSVTTADTTISALKKPQITKVFVSTDLTNLVIIGEHFGKDPEVGLGKEWALIVLDADEPQITAKFPKRPHPGDYLLTVIAGYKFRWRKAEFNVAIPSSVNVA